MAGLGASAAAAVPEAGGCGPKEKGAPPAAAEDAWGRPKANPVLLAGAEAVGAGGGASAETPKLNVGAAGASAAAGGCSPSAAFAAASLALVAGAAAKEEAAGR